MQPRAAQRLRGLGEGPDERGESRFGVGGSLFGGHRPILLSLTGSGKSGRTMIRFIGVEVLEGRLTSPTWRRAADGVPFGGASGQLAPGHLGLRLDRWRSSSASSASISSTSVTCVTFGGLGPFEAGSSAWRSAARAAVSSRCSSRRCSARSRPGAFSAAAPLARRLAAAGRRRGSAASSVVVVRRRLVRRCRRRRRR